MKCESMFTDDIDVRMVLFSISYHSSASGGVALTAKVSINSVRLSRGR